MHSAGDVVLVPFPYTDQTSTKVRPALVMTRPVNGGRDVVVLGITSNMANEEHSVIIEDSDLARGRLATTSRVKCTRITTVEIALIRKTVGSLTPSAIESVRKELRALLRA